MTLNNEFRGHHMTFTAHLLPGCLMMGISFVPADQAYVCIVLMTLAFAMNGAVTQTTVANYHDLGPTTAASTTAIVNVVAATSGFLSPMVVAFFTSEKVRCYD